MTLDELERQSRQDRREVRGLQTSCGRTELLVLVRALEDWVPLGHRKVLRRGLLQRVTAQARAEVTSALARESDSTPIEQSPAAWSSKGRVDVRSVGNLYRDG